MIHSLPQLPEALAFPVLLNQLASRAGFIFNVSVSDKLVDRVFIADGKHSVEECLDVFLRTCAGQLKIALIDNKGWETVRLFYPMSNLDGSFTPEEVVITTRDIGVEITLASERLRSIQ
jgi:hypothetical protein